jgi:hypothetical protein
MAFPDDPARTFLSRALPWDDAGAGDGWLNVHWKTAGGMPGESHQNVDAMLTAIERLKQPFKYSSPAFAIFRLKPSSPIYHGVLYPQSCSGVRSRSPAIAKFVAMVLRRKITCLDLVKRRKRPR